MSKGYPHPQDEFDVADGLDGPRGVHRAPRSTWTKIWPFALVLVLFSGLAFAGVKWFANTGEPLPGPIGDLAQGTPDATAEEPDAPATEEAPVAEAPADEPPAPTVDLAAPVTVLNGAKVNGLAATVAATLEDAGFTSVTPDNYTGQTLATSTVFYATEDQVATAEAAAAALGIATVTLSAPQAPNGVTVVLAPGFSG